MCLREEPSDRCLHGRVRPSRFAVGDVVEHAHLVSGGLAPTRPGAGTPVRYVVVAVLRLGLKLQPVGADGALGGRPLLVGWAQVDQVIKVA